MLNDNGLQLEVMKCEPQTIEAALSHAIKLEAYEQSVFTLYGMLQLTMMTAMQAPATYCLCSYRSIGCG